MSTAVIDAVDTDTDDGQLFLRAELRVPMSFVCLVGVNEMTVQIISQVTRKKLNIEVAMVLDNSGSMNDYSRMTNLKSAATCATNILFLRDLQSGRHRSQGAQHQDRHRAVHQLRQCRHVQQDGVLDGPDRRLAGVEPQFRRRRQRQQCLFDVSVNRWTLYDQLNNVSWEGCVEARPHPYDTDDTAPSICADPQTLFVPVFAPDESDDDTFRYGYYNYAYYNNYLGDAPSACYRVRGTCSRTYSWTIPATPTGWPSPTARR